MDLSGKKIGFAITGSHCTYQEIWPQVEKLKKAGAEVYPLASPAAAETDSRFGRGEEIVAHFAQLTGRPVITTIVEAEPLGPQALLDAHPAHELGGVLAGDRPLHGEHLCQAGQFHNRYGCTHGRQGAAAQRQASGFGHLHQRCAWLERQEPGSTAQHSEGVFCAVWPG